MSRSPHRYRADAAELWSRLLFGELVRAIDREVVVRDEANLRLPRAGRWETGLARVRPAFDDALGSTALAVAWRWACAESDALCWPGLPLIAEKATDRPVRRAFLRDELALFVGGGRIAADGGRCRWLLWRADGLRASIAVEGVSFDPHEVDRAADVAAAWFEADWRREGQSPE
jgi:hypothetical protein